MNNVSSNAARTTSLQPIRWITKVDKRNNWCGIFLKIPVYEAVPVEPATPFVLPGNRWNHNPRTWTLCRVARNLGNMPLTPGLSIKLTGSTRVAISSTARSLRTPARALTKQTAHIRGNMVPPPSRAVVALWQ